MATTGTTALDHYLAGIFDGEGCVSVSFHNHAMSMTATASVAMCDREPIDLLHKRFGGVVKIEQPKNDGKHRPRRLRYRWSVRGKSATEALGVFAVLCKIKHRRASAAAIIASLLPGTGRVFSKTGFGRATEAAEFIIRENASVFMERGLGRLQSLRERHGYDGNY